ncbi:uncharacterized protein BDZ83DRAFT_599277 [Colletotrichum acutatum]|uniref:Uncharacterized protein n=1 Tax=Glomerella acutata TaxID=27357 RepID=A0AAD8XPB5_GLOAC|nr:uncharacterized protein BDZ83DRAFT_599277 [Colletotrichum acutatum]KAK1730949.1 hypothetical protein BDZ83DRAFT_599277 [Colletotrichum acutatum]
MHKSAQVVEPVVATGIRRYSQVRQVGWSLPCEEKPFISATTNEPLKWRTSPFPGSRNKTPKITFETSLFAGPHPMLELAYSATSPGTRRRGQQGSALIPSPTASPQRAKGPNHYGSCAKNPSRTPSSLVSPRLRGSRSLPQLEPAHRMERPGGDGATKTQESRSHRQAGCASSTRTRVTRGPVHQETAPVFQNKLVEVLPSPHMPANLINTIRNIKTEGPHHGKA